MNSSSPNPMSVRSNELCCRILKMIVSFPPFALQANFEFASLLYLETRDFVFHLRFTTQRCERNYVKRLCFRLIKSFVCSTIRVLL